MHIDVQFTFSQVVTVEAEEAAKVRHL